MTEGLSVRQYKKQLKKAYDRLARKLPDTLPTRRERKAWVRELVKMRMKEGKKNEKPAVDL